VTPRRITRRRRERIHQRPPDPVEDADRPLEEPPAPPDRFPKRDEPGEAGPPDEPPHHRLSHPIDEPDETSDSDPYDDPRDR
jgi:hypothetical protein